MKAGNEMIVIGWVYRNRIDIATLYDSLVGVGLRLHHIRRLHSAVGRLQDPPAPYPAVVYSTFGFTGSMTSDHKRPVSSKAPFFPVFTFTQVFP